MSKVPIPALEVFRFIGEYSKGIWSGSIEAGTMIASIIDAHNSLGPSTQYR